MASTLLKTLLLILAASIQCHFALLCNQGDCGSVIYCPDNTNCHLTCNQYGCNNRIINCPTSHQCDVNCMNPSACQDATIICPDDAGCNIQCMGSNACHSMTIIGGNDDNTGNSARLTVSCSQSNSCPHATFDGRSAHELSITGCTDSNSCIGITVYCPENVGGTKKCNIGGNNNMGGTINNPLTLYAINGWNDINMISNTLNRIGTLNCKPNYDTLCTIDPNPLDINADWTCNNGKDCDELTPSPTHAPSTKQTSSSPTSVPTSNPLISPTTAIPTTNNPTTSLPTTMVPTTNNPTTTSVPTTTSPTTNNPTTNNPTTDAPTTNEPTVTPTAKIETCLFDEFGAMITLSFDYIDKNVNDLSMIQVNNIIQNVTNEFVENEISQMSDECVLDAYKNDIEIKENNNEAIVNITACFKCNEKLIINHKQINELQKDFIELFDNEILIIDDTTIKIDVDIIQPEGSVSELITTTENNYTNKMKHSNNNNASIIIIIIVLILLTICCIIVGVYIYKLKQKNKIKEQVNVMNVDLDLNESNIHTNMRSHSHQIGEIIQSDDLTGTNSNIMNEDEVLFDDNDIITLGNDNTYKNNSELEGNYGTSIHNENHESNTENSQGDDIIIDDVNKLTPQCPNDNVNTDSSGQEDDDIIIDDVNKLTPQCPNTDEIVVDGDSDQDNIVTSGNI